MLIAENTRRSSARVLYGILAQSALSQFDAPLDTQHRSAYFQNLLKLLEMYQYGTLCRPSHRAVLDRHEVTKEEFQMERSEAERVEAAIQAAHNATFQNLSREELVQRLRNIFIRVSEGQPVAPEDVASAKNFLTILRKTLRA
jgi:hypothetical protein